MLLKSRGQLLWVAAAFHALFNMSKPTAIPEEISENAMKVALNFVDVCNQNEAYLAGKGLITDAIDALLSYIVCDGVVYHANISLNNATSICTCNNLVNE